MVSSFPKNDLTVLCGMTAFHVCIQQCADWDPTIEKAQMKTK